MKLLTGLVLSLVLALSAAATEITFEKSLTWKQIKEKAAKENKMIFFDAYTSWCGPCKYLENKVYTDDAVASYYNANYINVKFDMEDGEGISLAEELGVTSYPTLLFFSPEGKVVHKFIGAMDAGQFINLGKDAQDPSKQYFGLKEKAEQLQLSDADFSVWASQADRLEDSDKELIIATYLQSKEDILGNKDIANTVLMFTDVLTDRQLTYLHSNQSKITQLMGWDAERTASVLYKKLFRQGAAVYEKSGNKIDSFRALIKKFDPKKENYAVKDLLFRVAVFIDKDMNKASNLLIQYLKDTQKPLAIDDLAGWLLDYATSFEVEQIQKINSQLSLFKLRPIDKGKEYWLWLMQMMCYAKAGNEAKAKLFAEKAYHHAGLAVEYKEVLKESYGFTD